MNYYIVCDSTLDNVVLKSHTIPFSDSVNRMLYHYITRIRSVVAELIYHFVDSLPLNRSW